MSVSLALAPVPDELRFVRVGPGVYDSADGRVTLYRIEGCRPIAWNVEWMVDFQNALVEVGYERPLSDHVTELALTLIVDGAASFRDAKLLAADAWPAVRDRLRAIEARP